VGITDIPMKKKLLVISHVWPFPGHSGQEMRVRNSLIALKKEFQITFLTVGSKKDSEDLRVQMNGYCDELLCLPSRYNRNFATKVFYKALAQIRSFANGLKPSNYLIGDLELTPKRIERVLDGREFDCVLFEYWHAYKCTAFFKRKGTPCILDMHNILSESNIAQRPKNPWILGKWKSQSQDNYRNAEEHAWGLFDGIIAINKLELRYVDERLNGVKLFYVPMGIVLSDLKYCWNPCFDAPKIAYYGGLNSLHNAQSAMDCYHKIMPAIWKKFPNAELWIVGSNPPKSLQEIARNDERVVVTGFVNDLSSVMGKILAVVCPWQGTYGFRSRVIEVMALGIPVVTTSSAVYGMELTHEKGILLSSDNDGLVHHLLRLMSDRAYSENQSNLARFVVDNQFSLEGTYGRFASDLSLWLDGRAHTQSMAVCAT
jgi:glycosyltransferase involved in cell wall biosynthesis